MVTLTAEDSFGASDSIMVTITVTDMDETPAVSGDATKEYAENGTGQVARYTAVDPEQTAIVSWSLAGTDASLFFDIEGGALTFKKAPNFEMTDTGNMYEVTVQATDSTNKVGTKDVSGRGHQRGGAWKGDPVGVAAAVCNPVHCYPDRS